MYFMICQGIRTLHSAVSVPQRTHASAWLHTYLCMQAAAPAAARAHRCAACGDTGGRTDLVLPGAASLA